MKKIKKMKNNNYNSFESLNLDSKLFKKLLKSGVEFEDLCKLSLPEIKKLKGISSISAIQIAAALTKIGINVKTTQPKKEKAPDTLRELKTKIIEKFIKDELLSGEKAKDTWSLNMRMCNTLLKKYPDENFWNSFVIPFKLNCLAFFLSEKGREYINAYFNKGKVASMIEASKKPVEPLELEKQGEDANIQKPKTLKDFLKL